MEALVVILFQEMEQSVKEASSQKNVITIMASVSALINIVGNWGLKDD